MPLIEGLSTAETFPYAGENHEPQQLDPITDYVLDWNKFSSNNSVFEFPKAEFDLGLKIERNKDAKGKIMDVARKVIDNLSVDPTFYSNIKDRKQ